MTRLVVFGLLSFHIVFAQPTSMAVSSDGAIFEFASRWALRTEPLAINPNRIFRFGPSPAIRLASVPNTDIAYPLVSADASTIGVYTTRPCFGSCMFPTPSHAIQLTRDGKQILLTGNELRLSRNGRFVFDSGFPNLHPGPYLIDLDTNQRIPFPNVLTRHVRNTLTDDGALLSTEPGWLPGIGDISTYGELRLTPFNQPSITILKDIQSRLAAISPHGSTVIAFTTKLIAIDTKTLGQTTLLESGSPIQSLSTSYDGASLLVTRANELLLWTRSSGWLSLLSHGEGFSEAILTDDGQTALAITGAGRYFRINTANGTMEQLYAPSPAFLSPRTGGTYPGSLLRIATNLIPPNTHFTLDGAPLPVIKQEATFIDLQIPWETQARSAILEAAPDDSPFTTRVRINLAERPIPWIVTQDQSNLIAAAQANFDSLVTLSNPAPPGSLIHFYVTGLGPLDQPVPTGAPGPANPPARPLASIACYLAPDRPNPPVTALRLPTVIYAPNLIGVYQIDAELPQSWPSGNSILSCRGEGFEGSIATIPIG